MMSAAVAGPTSIRPIASYTTLRDVTILAGADHFQQRLQAISGVRGRQRIGPASSRVSAVAG